jgi:hypothetical protein
VWNLVFKTSRTLEPLWPFRRFSIDLKAPWQSFASPLVETAYEIRIHFLFSWVQRVVMNSPRNISLTSLTNHSPYAQTAILHHKKSEKGFSFFHFNRMQKKGAFYFESISKREERTFYDFLLFFALDVWHFLLLLIVWNWLDYAKICFICMQYLLTIPDMCLENKVKEKSNYYWLLV